MSLRFVCGKAGTGKSSFCFDEIKEKIKKNETVYIITPEQFSFTAEQKLLNLCENGSSLNAEVITFGRMANRIINQIKNMEKSVISTQAKQACLYTILDKEKNNLNFLGKSKENVDLIQRTITELKKHCVSVNILGKQIENTSSVYLKKKLEDILLVYKAYEEKINAKYYDENDILNILIDNLEKVNTFDNSNIYIDEFSGFTTQEYEIIKILLKKAKYVTVTICKENTDPVIEENIFYSNYVTITKLIKIAKDQNIKIEDTIFLNEPYRFKSKELKALEQSLSTYTYKPYLEDTKHLHLFLASNPYSEIKEVARQINWLVQEKEYRYRDIGIIAKEQEEYVSLVKAIFNEEEIPVFIDEKRDLSQNIFVKFILSVLEIFAKSFSYDAMFASIKTGFYDIEKNDIFKLENYCLHYGIRGKTWYEKDWEYGKENGEDLEKLNNLRKKIIEPLVEFSMELKYNRTVKEMTTKLYEFLQKINIEEKLGKRIQKVAGTGNIEISEEYISSLQIVVDTLDEIVGLFGDEIISFEKYEDILKLAFKADLQGMIPASLDQVILGDAERSRSHKVKAIFILGVNDGIFPSFQKEEGFLNDEDRNYLKNQGLELAKSSYENLYEDQFNIYKAFTVAEEEIYISYVSADKEGKALRPSIFIHKLKKNFPKLVEESDIIEQKLIVENENASFETMLGVLQQNKEGIEMPSIWCEVYNYYSQSEKWKSRLNLALRGISGIKKAEKVESNNIKKLYGNVLKTSVSRLEQYRKCPFSFHLKYGLRLKEKAEFKLKTVDTGTFMHEVIQAFFDKVDVLGISIKKITEEEIEKLVNEIVEDFLCLPKNYLFSSTPKFKSMTMKLKKTVTKSITYIVYQLQNSNFEVCGTEVEFSDKSAYEPIKLELETGEKIEVTGKIDRIDIAKTENGKYLRIIDYKSSAHSIDFNEVLAGLQIQLLTYMDAASNIEEAIPAGMLYFNLLSKNLGKCKTSEEIKKQIISQFKMKGVLLADVEVVKMMDTSLETGYSQIIPAYVGKDGLSISKSNVITKEEFNALQKYTKKLIKRISSEILKGNIEIKPYYNSKTKKAQCEYCSYKGICGFDPKENSYFEIPILEKQEVLEKVVKEN